MELYIGLMSGTSADGIDAVLVNFAADRPQVLGTHYTRYSDELRARIVSLYQKGEDEIRRLNEVDILLGKEFAHAVNNLLQKNNLTAKDIKAIGSHGQTIRHAPQQSFTMQIGNPNIIAASTGITTVADFRRKDMALGGQGAPLVPAFHQSVFAAENCFRVIVNIGGIANITLLPKRNTTEIFGFDTGPGNVLLDEWIFTHQQKSHDEKGKWAAQGKVNPDLLERLLSDNYFQLPYPKSTGREYFNYQWLQNYLNSFTQAISPIDIQATLVELTARSIMIAIRKCTYDAEILVCGGGAHNETLMNSLTNLAAPQYHVTSTQQHGIDPDWVEAIAFAWLAKQTLNNQPGNIPSVTGASHPATLGGIYY